MLRTYPASLDQLYPMLAFIRAHAIASGFDPTTISHIELACEEALVNIINYAYSDELGELTITCGPPDGTGIKIELRDQGIPFDPLANRQKPNSEKLGGYGVEMIVKLMDEVTYQHDGADNILMLIKRLK